MILNWLSKNSETKLNINTKYMAGILVKSFLLHQPLGTACTLLKKEKHVMNIKKL